MSKYIALFHIDYGYTDKKNPVPSQYARANSFDANDDTHAYNMAIERAKEFAKIFNPNPITNRTTVKIEKLVNGKVVDLADLESIVQYSRDNAIFYKPQDENFRSVDFKSSGQVYAFFKDYK